MGAVATCAPHEKLSKGSCNSFLSKLWNSEVPYRRSQSDSGSRPGLRCFNNPPGDYFSLSDYGGHWIQGCEGRLVGCRQCHPARTPTFATTDKSPRCSN